MCSRSVPCSGLRCLASDLKLPPAKFELRQGRDSAFGLNSVLKAAMNGDLVLEDKPVWFILHSEEGIEGRFLT